MKQPLLIGISGVKRSGKNTAAQFISSWVASLGHTSADRGFADKVKWAFARQFFPMISFEDAMAWVNEHKDDVNINVVIESRLSPMRHIAEVNFRDAIAQFATESARDIYGVDHWLDQLLPTSMIIDENDIPAFPRWRENFDHADFCCVTDLRFANEFARFKMFSSSITVKIRRREAELAVVEEAKARGRDIHLSELGLPEGDFDYVINNNTSKEEFALRVRNMMKQIYNDKCQ